MLDPRGGDKLSETMRFVGKDIPEVLFTSQIVLLGFHSKALIVLQNCCYIIVSAK